MSKFFIINISILLYNRKSFYIPTNFSFFQFSTQIYVFLRYVNSSISQTLTRHEVGLWFWCEAKFVVKCRGQIENGGGKSMMARIANANEPANAAMKPQKYIRFDQRWSTLWNRSQRNDEATNQHVTWNLWNERETNVKIRQRIYRMIMYEVNDRNYTYYTKLHMLSEIL